MDMLHTVIRPSIESGADGLAGVLHDVPGGTGGADTPDQGKDEVLGGHPGGRAPVEADFHGAGPGLDDALGGQDVLHLARADTEGERAEGPVSGGVGVSADDDHPRPGDPQLGADHVDDALLRRIEVEELHPEFPGVPYQRRHLPGGDLVGNGETAVAGGDVVVDRGDGQLRPPHPAAGRASTRRRPGAR